MSDSARLSYPRTTASSGRWNRRNSQLFVNFTEASLPARFSGRNSTDDSGTTTEVVMSSSIWSFFDGAKSLRRLKVRQEPSSVNPIRR